jgi:hypothetical protein
LGLATAFFLSALVIASPPLIPVNIIDGPDDRGSILERGPALGLSPAEIARIRKVSGHVACAGDQAVTGSGALFLTNGQILTAGHIFFGPSGDLATKCFFRPQAPNSQWMELDLTRAKFGATPPKPGSNNDWAIVRLKMPIAGAEPFPPAATPPAKGDALVVVSAQPAGFEQVDPNVPIVQGCTVRRVPVSSSTTSFYRTDCDAGGGSSGGMHLARVDDQLVFRGMTISTGPWRDPKFIGAPYDEKAGSVTTALGTDAAILTAGKSLAAP